MEPDKCPCCRSERENERCQNKSCDLYLGPPKDKPVELTGDPRAVEAILNIGKNCQKAMINVPPGCEYTINGERAFQLSELRSVAMSFTEKPSSVLGDSVYGPALIETCRIVLRGFGNQLRVDLFPDREEGELNEQKKG